MCFVCRDKKGRPKWRGPWRRLLPLLSTISTENMHKVHNPGIEDAGYRWWFSVGAACVLVGPHEVARPVAFCIASTTSQIELHPSVLIKR